MAEGDSSEVELVYLELADWILSFSSGAAPEHFAQLIREASEPIG